MIYTINGKTYLTDPSAKIEKGDWFVCTYKGKTNMVTYFHEYYRASDKSDLKKIIETNDAFLVGLHGIKKYKENLSDRIRKAVRIFPDHPKPGIMFEDINPIFLDSKLCRDIAIALSDINSKEKIDAICAIESRGFFIGILISQILEIPLFMVRKKGKLPGEVVSYSYDLEYGSSTLELQKGTVNENWNVMIHDDILATGGTAAAAAELIKMQGGNIHSFSFINSLNLGGEEKLKKYSEKIIFAVN
jgi:adenine phosphoribosyltransferase